MRQFEDHGVRTRLSCSVKMIKTILVMHFKATVGWDLLIIFWVEGGKGFISNRIRLGGGAG